MFGKQGRLKALYACRQDFQRPLDFHVAVRGAEEACLKGRGWKVDALVEGVPEEDVDRTNADGKASSVQFLHFPFSADQIDKFKNPDTRIMLGIEHEKYAHAVILPPEVRDALAADFAD